MTVQEYRDLLELARNRENWTSELFRQYQEACHMIEPFMVQGYHVTCIFEDLRRILPEEEYREFDLAYCEYIQPGQKGVVRYLDELHRREAAGQWEHKRIELLKKKKRLLIAKSRLLTGS